GRRARWGARIAIFHLGTLAIPLAGVSLTLGHYGGLFWLVLTILMFFLWSTINAWTLVVRTIEELTTRPSSSLKLPRASSLEESPSDVIASRGHLLSRSVPRSCAS